MFSQRGTKALPFVLALIACPIAGYSQQSGSSPIKGSIHTPLAVCAALPPILKEASGLETTGSGIFWTHNDDRLPVLYGLDTSGNMIKTIHLNHPNNGWEDLTVDGDQNLYIGAFGNNKNDRRDLAILKIRHQDLNRESVINAEVIQYQYSDQQQFPPKRSRMNFDADALVSIRDSLYVITKNRTYPFTGYTKVYQLPSTPGKYKAMLYDSIFLGNGEMMDHWVTSADVSPDGNLLALLSHDCVWIISDFRGTRFSTGQIHKVQLDNFSHKAGICFATPNLLYIVDELEFGVLGGKLYLLDLNKIPGIAR